MIERVPLILAQGRRLKFVRETRINGKAVNRGRFVEAIQRIGGTAPGQPWCACYVCTVFGLACDGWNPFAYTASCDDLLSVARKNAWLRDTPAAGAVFLRMASPNDADHTGFCTELITDTRWGSLEGNASDPTATVTREGWGVFERTPEHPLCRKHPDPQYQFVHWWLPAKAA